MVTALPAPVRVLIVDDDPFVRSGVRSLLATKPEAVTVVGERADGTQVEDAVRDLTPDVVLIDVRMPGLDGPTAVERAASRPGAPRFLMMTAFDDDGSVLDAIGAGAAGFLLKDEDPHGILDAVLQVARGEAVLSRRSAAHLAGWVRRSAGAGARREARQRMDALTPRERDLAIALADGPTDAELGERFHIAESTVKSTLQDINTKWGTRNRTQIAVVAVRAGA